MCTERQNQSGFWFRSFVLYSPQANASMGLRMVVPPAGREAGGRAMRCGYDVTAWRTWALLFARGGVTFACPTTTQHILAPVTCYCVQAGGIACYARMPRMAAWLYHARWTMEECIMVGQQA